MKTETKLLLQQCRDALLQQRDEQIAALLTQWFEGMIGEEDMEEDLDDLCLLLHYRVQSRGSQRSYATYTSWWEVEGALQPSEGTFLCADVPSLRQRLLEMSPRQLDLVVELAYQVRARGAELEGEARPSTGHAGLREMATWLAQVRPSALVERWALPPAPRPIERQEERRQREQEKAARAPPQRRARDGPAGAKRSRRRSPASRATSSCSPTRRKGCRIPSATGAKSTGSPRSGSTSSDGIWPRCARRPRPSAGSRPARCCRDSRS